MSWESFGIALLTASLVRPFGLVAVAWVLRRLFGVRHPASRHAVWTAVLLGMMVLPFVSVLTPHWKLPVLPARRSSSVAAIAAAPADLITSEPVASAAYRAPEPAPASESPSFPTLVIWAYFAGILAMLAYRLTGLALLRRVMSRSTPVRSRIVLESSDVLAPIAVGVLRPVVILPAGWRDWSAGTKRAVFAHEFAHLRRHDALISTLTWWVRSLLWFHPLAWWISGQVSNLAEMACDLAAVGHVGDPAGYSRMLLGFADSVNRAGQRVTLPGLAMAQGSKMDRRIDGVFELAGGSMRKLTRSALVLATIGVPVVCFAAVVGFGDRGGRAPNPPVVSAPPIEAQSQPPVPAALPDRPIIAAAPQRTTPSDSLRARGQAGIRSSVNQAQCRLYAARRGRQRWTRRRGTHTSGNVVSWEAQCWLPVCYGTNPNGVRQVRGWRFSGRAARSD